jgi:hypothetical protein
MLSQIMVPPVYLQGEKQCRLTDDSLLESTQGLISMLDLGASMFELLQACTYAIGNYCWTQSKSNSLDCAARRKIAL